MNPVGIIFWIAACIAIPFIAKDRKPGTFSIFFICLFWAPLIGLIVALFAKKKVSEDSESKEVAQTQE